MSNVAKASFEKADLAVTGERPVARKLIVDNDCGVDDAWGISLILKSTVGHQLLALTCVKGNTDVENVCNNNLYLLTVLGKKEIPVYKGANRSLLHMTSEELSDDLKYFHGRNGFGDVQLPCLADKPQVQKENAVVALNRLTSENKGEITLVCLAPLTNIALAIRTYPDFVDNVKDVFIMGGNYQGVGNTTSCAEFNFHADPEAANIVLREMQNKIYLLPWETCMGAKIPFEWRERLLTDCGPVFQFLNKIELPILERLKNLGYKTYISADQLLCAILINPNIVQYAFKAYALVELAGVFTRGQVILDHMQSKPKQSEFLTVISEVDSIEYFNIINSMKNV
ncbi:uncharacterized protein C1683.06c-like [Cimex lectularius]|uniref:Inosine/uridine-preferring nucleoside hydrolase domain-containing protein n=1 Tax=Cimex lectularius TaxID=79782 RepID=A0A8I6TG94_CIMLE|nr:uncharacterized protein C1683.06c-like [Cimex lectularius]